MKIGRKIYYDKATGNVILVTSEMDGYVTPTTVEQDIETYKALSERNPETFDVIELEFGEYTQDFAECITFRVNPDNGKLEFGYPDKGNPQSPTVVQAPLTVQIEELQERVSMTEDAILMLMDLGVMGNVLIRT